VIRLDTAPKGYVDFDKGTAKKFVIDPHSQLSEPGIIPGGAKL
jgi:glutathione-independent formaldehyde dehydrogenase